MGQVNNIENISVDKLIPYANNSKKHPRRQMDILEKSIKEFGFITPCLVDEKNNVIAGHGRLQAAKNIGLAAVPCVRVEGLSEEQRKAYIIADNKVSELGEWDKDLVSQELSELDISNFDVDLTGFNIDDVCSLDDQDLPYGAERVRTANSVNLLEYDGQRSYPPYDIPILDACDVVPDDLIGFNYVLSAKESDYDCGVHFFLDDYQFERIWNNPKKYIEKLKRFKCVLTPDFSPYADMPTAMKIWNVYRNRMIGQMMQDAGLNVIPTITWSDRSTFDYVINGIRQGGTVAISTVSISKLKEDKQYRDIFQDGVDLVIERIKPKTIILYGNKKTEINTHGTDIVEMSPHVFEKKGR